MARKRRRKARRSAAQSSKKGGSGRGSSSGLYLTAIVGIVAVVAVVIMVMNSGASVDLGGDEITGLVTYTVCKDKSFVPCSNPKGSRSKDGLCLDARLLDACMDAQVEETLKNRFVAADRYSG